ncbi:hypothetical protein Taro_026944 [Colocasia esculenta]|uniref:Uncharacterized protein n=1 Tax=Colocasia esculenta TaxID=4460 RepID=A0A843VD88_COLES|nr:hypothetical protein [Colocasia esculenta]
MARNQDACFVSSAVKVSTCSIPTHPPFENHEIFATQSLCFHLERGNDGLSFPFAPHLPFARHNLSFHLQRTKDSIHRFLTSLPFGRGGLPSLSRLLRSPFSAARARAEPEPPGGYSRRHGKEAEERILISEVLIRNKDGDELEREDLATEAAAALKSCRPNSALTLREVQEDVHRIIESGYFFSCMPVAVDTRDGIRLVFQTGDLSILKTAFEIVYVHRRSAEVNHTSLAIITQFGLMGIAGNAGVIVKPRGIGF